MGNSFSIEKFSISEEKQYKQVLWTHKMRDIRIWTINVTGICKSFIYCQIPWQESQRKRCNFFKEQILGGKNSNQITSSKSSLQISLSLAPAHAHSTAPTTAHSWGTLQGSGSPELVENTTDRTLLATPRAPSIWNFRWDAALRSCRDSQQRFLGNKWTWSL